MDRPAHVPGPPRPEFDPRLRTGRDLGLYARDHHAAPQRSVVLRIGTARPRLEGGRYPVERSAQFVGAAGQVRESHLAPVVGRAGVLDRRIEAEAADDRYRPAGGPAFDVQEPHPQRPALAPDGPQGDRLVALEPRGGRNERLGLVVRLLPDRERARLRLAEPHVHGPEPRRLERVGADPLVVQLQRRGEVRESERDGLRLHRRAVRPEDAETGRAGLGMDGDVMLGLLSGSDTDPVDDCIAQLRGILKEIVGREARVQRTRAVAGDDAVDSGEEVPEASHAVVAGLGGEPEVGVDLLLPFASPGAPLRHRGYLVAVQFHRGAGQGLALLVDRNLQVAAPLAERDVTGRRVAAVGLRGRDIRHGRRTVAREDDYRERFHELPGRPHDPVMALVIAGRLAHVLGYRGRAVIGGPGEDGGPRDGVSSCVADRPLGPHDFAAGRTEEAGLKAPLLRIGRVRGSKDQSHDPPSRLRSHGLGLDGHRPTGAGHREEVGARDHVGQHEPPLLVAVGPGAVPGSRGPEGQRQGDRRPRPRELRVQRPLDPGEPSQRREVRAGYPAAHHLEGAGRAEPHPRHHHAEPPHPLEPADEEPALGVGPPGESDRMPRMKLFRTLRREDEHGAIGHHRTVRPPDGHLHHPDRGALATIRSCPSRTRQRVWAYLNSGSNDSRRSDAEGILSSPPEDLPFPSACILGQHPPVGPSAPSGRGESAGIGADEAGIVRHGTPPWLAVPGEEERDVGRRAPGPREPHLDLDLAGTSVIDRVGTARRAATHKAPRGHGRT